MGSLLQVIGEIIGFMNGNVPKRRVDLSFHSRVVSKLQTTSEKIRVKLVRNIIVLV